MKNLPLPKVSFKAVGISALTALVLACGTTAHAQSYYVTTFDNFNTPSTLSGQDAWDTNDANQSDFVGVTPGYSVSASDYWAQLGGNQQPGNTAGLSPVYLFRPVSLLAGKNVGFNTDMAIGRSQTPYTNNDGFAWSFLDSTQANPTPLFSVDFVPTTATAGTGVTTYAVRYTVNGVQTTTGKGIVSDSRYHLTVSVNVTTDQFGFTITPNNGTAPLQVGNIALTNADVNNIASAAATWNVQTVGNAGSNELYFNNYSLIPEPSTWAMLGTGILAVAILARRRSRA